MVLDFDATPPRLPRSILGGQLRARRAAVSARSMAVS